MYVKQASAVSSLTGAGFEVQGLTQSPTTQKTLKDSRMTYVTKAKLVLLAAQQANKSTDEVLVQGI